MSEAEIVGSLFLAGALCFFGIGFGIAFARRELSSTQGVAQLPAIARHVAAWRGIPVGFGLGTVITAVAFAANAFWFGRTFAGALAVVAALLYAVGVAAFLPTLAFQWSAKVRAAQDQARSGAVPDWFAPLELWSESLYAVYMLLAYSSIAFTGIAFTDLVSTELLGPFSIAFGSLGVISFATRWPRVGTLVVSDLPLWIHVWAIVAGLSLTSPWW